MKRFYLLLLACSLHATTYYVATTGSDSNTSMQAQNPATPWLSPQHAVNNINCGDTIIGAADGTWTDGGSGLDMAARRFCIQGESLRRMIDMVSSDQTPRVDDKATLSDLLRSVYVMKILLDRERNPHWRELIP